MRYGHICLFTAVCCTLNWTALAQGPDVATSLKRFSDVQKINIRHLLGGEILAERGATTNYSSGISAQFCFAVPASPEETARRLQGGDASGPEGPNVYAHCVLHTPSTPGDFSKLYLDPKQGPTKWLLDKTIRLGNGSSELNLSRTDASELAACVKKSPDPKVVSACWAAILSERAAAFQLKGFNGVLPYDSAESVQYNQIDQLRIMLREHPKVIDELSPVLVGAGLIHGGSDVPRLTPSHYWSLFDANHRAVVNLGAIYRSAVNDHYQVLDVEYYVSDSYYAAATLYEIWPIRDAGKTGSLVWRGDFYVAPMLKYMKGMERIAYGVIMIQEIKREINRFQSCFSAKPDTGPAELDLLP
jgi:hypothetical protein